MHTIHPKCDISNSQYYLGQIRWIVCTLGCRDLLCSRMTSIKLFFVSNTNNSKNVNNKCKKRNIYDIYSDSSPKNDHFVINYNKQRNHHI